MKFQLKKIVKPQDADTKFYRFDWMTGFWGIPNIEGKIAFDGGVLIRVCHNSEGNRDRPVQPGLSNRNILCFGGSNTWGGYVEQEQRYTDRLTAQTKRNFINLGHCSLGLDQICIAILTRAQHYSPSVIIVEQYPWAIHRVLNTYVNGYLKPFFYLDSDGSLKLQKLPRLASLKFYRKMIGSYRTYKKELQEFKNGIDIKTDYDFRTDPIFLYWKTQYYDYMYSLADKIMGVIRDYCAQLDCKLIFTLLAVSQQFGQATDSILIDYNLPTERLIRLLEKNDISYVNTTQALLREHSVEGPVIKPDGHLNMKGHEIVAKVLQVELEKKGWL